MRGVMRAATDGVVTMVAMTKSVTISSKSEAIQGSSSTIRISNVFTVHGLGGQLSRTLSNVWQCHAKHIGQQGVPRPTKGFSHYPCLTSMKRKAQQPLLP